MLMCCAFTVSVLDLCVGIVFCYLLCAFSLFRFNVLKSCFKLKLMHVTRCVLNELITVIRI